MKNEHSRKKFLKEMNDFMANSKLTEKDALILGRKVNKAVAKRYKKLIK